LKALNWAFGGFAIAATMVVFASAKQGTTAAPTDTVVTGILGAVVGITLSMLRSWMIVTARRFILGWMIAAASAAIAFLIVDFFLFDRQATIGSLFVFSIVLAIGVCDWWLVLDRKTWR
jgi:hypothetical protein